MPADFFWRLQHAEFVESTIDPHPDPDPQGAHFWRDFSGPSDPVASGRASPIEKRPKIHALQHKQRIVFHAY